MLSRGDYQELLEQRSMEVSPMQHELGQAG